MLFLRWAALLTLSLAASWPALGEEGQRIRVLTYNIHHGRGLDGQIDLERIAKVIQGAKPDLVALQECDQKTDRARGVDQPAQLGKRTQMNVVFAANLQFQGGGYGNAVLSRWPIVGHQNHLLPTLGGGEQRGVLEVEVQPPGDAPTLCLLATHLDHRAEDRQRLASCRAIEALVSKRAARPAILAGDLNATPQSKVMRCFDGHWRRGDPEAALRPRPTFPAGKPKRQIDYVLLRPAQAWRVEAAEVVEAPTASDHRPLLVVARLAAN